MTDSNQLIYNYLPNLSKEQREQIAALSKIYKDWNQKVNLISRKDMEHFYERHVLHSLSIAMASLLKEDVDVLDIGTGGGFPGIPLAIIFPGNRFKLVDSIGKKIKIVEEVIQELGLKNVKAIKARAETLTEQFDFVVSRATAPMADLIKWSMPLIRKKPGNGLLALKGGDLSEELKPIRQKVQVVDISKYFTEEYFETKKLVFLPA